jgi:hypothetical protein
MSPCDALATHDRAVCMQRQGSLATVLHTKPDVPPSTMLILECNQIGLHSCLLCKLRLQLGGSRHTQEALLLSKATAAPALQELAPPPIAPAPSTWNT